MAPGKTMLNKMEPTAREMRPHLMRLRWTRPNKSAIERLCFLVATLSQGIRIVTPRVFLGMLA